MSDETGVTTQRRRRVEIEQIVAEFAESGLNRTEFCRRHGMSLGTLNRYRQRQREQSDRGEAKGGLVAVELAGTKFATDSEGGCRLAVVLSGRRKIEVGAGFDAPTLERLIVLLENL